MKGTVPMTEGKRGANRSIYAAMYLLGFLVMPSGPLLAAGSAGPALGLPVFRHQGVVLDPPPGTDQVAGACYLPWQGWHYLTSHANRAADPGSFNINFNLYIAEVDAVFEQAKHLGLFYDRTAVSAGNEAVMSPCIIAEGSKLYMFINIGPRLHNKIALAVADVPAARLEIHDGKLLCDRDKLLGLQWREEASSSPYQN
jgi:hypothetical protein